MKKQNFQLYKKSQVPVLVGVMAALLVAISYTYWISPLWDQVRSSSLSLAKAESTLEAKNEELNSLKKFKTFVNNESDKIEKMDEVLPPKENLDDVLVQIETLAVDNKMFVNSLSVATDNKDPEINGVDQVKLMLQLDGEYPDLLDFVKQVQNSTRLFLIDKMSVAANVDSEQQQPVGYTVELNILFQA